MSRISVCRYERDRRGRVPETAILDVADVERVCPAAALEQAACVGRWERMHAARPKSALPSAGRGVEQSDTLLAVDGQCSCMAAERHRHPSIHREALERRDHAMIAGRITGLGS